MRGQPPRQPLLPPHWRDARGLDWPSQDRDEGNGCGREGGAKNRVIVLCDLRKCLIGFPTLAENAVF